MVAPNQDRVGMDVLLAVSEPSEVRPLRDWLGRAPGVAVTLVSERPGSGELGTGDVLQIVATAAAGLLLAIRTLPEFIRSRRSNVKITITTREGQVVLDATSVEDVQPVLDRMLDGRRTDS